MSTNSKQMYSGIESVSTSLLVFFSEDKVFSDRTKMSAV